jgi:chemotaxis protein CheX
MPSAFAIGAPFVEELTAATGEVFRTMVSRHVQAGAPIVGDSSRPRAGVVGTVAFAGTTSGLVVLSSGLETATSITAAMLGIEPASLRGELPDAIGELTNMIAGSFRTRMANLGGEAWVISVPTVTMGSDFHTTFVSDVQRVLCPFRMDGAELFVELIVTRRAVQ